MVVVVVVVAVVVRHVRIKKHGIHALFVRFCERHHGRDKSKEALVGVGLAPLAHVVQRCLQKVKARHLKQLCPSESV